MGSVMLNEILYNDSAVPELLKTKQCLAEASNIAESLKKYLSDNVIYREKVNKIISGLSDLENAVHDLGVNIDCRIQEVNSMDNGENVSNSSVFNSTSESSSTNNWLIVAKGVNSFLQSIFGNGNYNVEFFSSGVSKKSSEELATELQRIQQKYFDTNKFDDYSLFRNLLVSDKFIGKVTRDSSYATQGCCEVNGNVFLTSYDTGYTIDGNGKCEQKNSILDIKDVYGREKTLFFNNTAHVGGVSYCEWNQKVYVSGEIPESGKNTVNCYDINQVATLADGETLCEDQQKILSKENDGIGKASYLTTHGKNLFVGEFEKDKDTTLVKYNLNQDGSIAEVKESYTVPYKKVQGMCITEYRGEEFYIFSTSSGRTNDSKLIISQLNEDSNTFETVVNLTLPCLSEQVSVDDSGKLMIVFESDCVKYGDGADGNGCASKQVGNVCYMDKNKLFEGLFAIKDKL